MLLGNGRTLIGAGLQSRSPSGFARREELGARERGEQLMQHVGVT